MSGFEIGENVTFVYILIAILVFCVLILVHEWGHFFAGRRLGFTIEEFSVGFGPLLLQRRDKIGTQFSLRALPLGGYCRFAGEDSEENQQGDFNAQPAWKRFIVQAAGAVCNILLAFLLALLLFAWVGSARPLIQEASAGKPAAEAGILPGDEILQVNDEAVNIQNITEVIGNAASAGGDMTLALGRNGQEINVDVDNYLDGESGRPMIGVIITSGSPVRLGLGEVLSYAAATTGESATEILRALGSIFVNPRTATENMSGPIGAVAVMGEGLEQSFNQEGAGAVSWKSGFSMLIGLAILLSVNLGVFNLLPLPALDGGRLVFTLIEMIARKPVPRRVEAYIHMAGILLLFGLSIFFAFNDISRLAGG